MSPCKDCTRRKVGCHNVETCKDWKKYVEALRAERAERVGKGYHYQDWANHVARRRKRKLPRV